MINKLGRLPRTQDQRVPHYSSVRTMDAFRLPPLPRALHNAAGLPAGNLGFMLNDRLGCCTVAGLGHAEQVWTACAAAAMVTVPDSAIEDAYRAACGWDGTAATDGGGVEQNVLTWASTTGWLQPGGQRTRLSAFVEIDTRNLTDVCEAIMECGLVYIGFEVPRGLPEEPGSAWDERVRGPIEGGHCVVCTGFDFAAGTTPAPPGPETPVLDVISWGDRYTMTRGFWERYVDECYALASPLWVEATGRTPFGLDPAALEELMRTIRG